MKKIMLVLTAVALVFTMVSCTKNENVKTDDVSEKEVVKEETSEENTPAEETTVVEGNSAFNFEISEIVTYTPEPVTVSDARIEISPDDFEFNLSMNLSEADRAKISGLSDEEIKLLAETKESFLNDLVSAMKKENIDIKMDTVSGEMVLDASILFAVDSSDVSTDGKSFLKKFIPAYASVVCKEKYKNFISELTVEGHTDTQGSYDYNKTLSQKRADNVSKYILSNEIDITSAERSLFKKLIKAYGCSYDNPIKDSSGKVDMDASRRVTIGFLISID